MIKHLFIALVLISATAPKVISEGDNDKVFIHHNEKKVCSGRLDKCFDIAMGSSQYPTPRWEGPRFLTTHYKDGFIWQNPLTGQKYQPWEHNLGPIWIEVYNNAQTSWQYGFHATPYPNIPLAQQESHGCLRMNMQDLLQLSNSLQYLDKFYSL